LGQVSEGLSGKGGFVRQCLSFVLGGCLVGCIGLSGRNCAYLLFLTGNGALGFRYSSFEQSLEVLCFLGSWHPDDLSAAQVLSYEMSGHGVSQAAAGRLLLWQTAIEEKS